MIDDLVYDVGMHNGDDTAYYLHRGYRVLAIEANPKMVERARGRFARQIEQGRLIILNVGISDEPGELPFWICHRQSDWCSFDRSIAARKGSSHHAIMVKCRSFKSVLDEHGVPCYLKVDIEGNDHCCVRDLNISDRPRYVSVEAWDINLLHLLRARGYSSFKYICQHNLIPMEFPCCANPRLERVQRLLWDRRLHMRVIKAIGLLWWLRAQMNRTRTLAGWTFPYGSSGPWGEGLPGKWQSLQEMVETFERFQGMPQRSEPGLFWNRNDALIWADFHARRDD